MFSGETHHVCLVMCSSWSGRCLHSNVFCSCLLRKEEIQEVRLVEGIKPTDIMVKFLVGEEKVMYEEDLSILVSSSPVFVQMFYGSLKEEEPILVPDTTPEAFSAMLKFLNGDVFPLLEDEIPSILYLAEKYMIHKLKKACMIEMRPTVDTVCSVLNMAYEFNLIEELKQEALRVFSEKTDIILKSQESFNLLSKDTLAAVLQCETMANTSESKIFSAVLQWAESRCEQKGLPCDGEQLRKQLEGVLKHIRFLNMTSQEFNKVKECGVLTSQEVEEYDKYTRSKGVIKPKLLYPAARPRQNSTFLNLKVPYIRIVSGEARKQVGYNCKSGEELEEMFEFTSGFSLKGIILPTQEVTDNPGFTYLEEFTIQVEDYSRSKIVATAHYREEVPCGTDICVMLPEEFSTHADSNTTYVSITITFSCSGCYPFNARRNFGTTKVLQKNGGVIVGFVFTRMWA